MLVLIHFAEESPWKFVLTVPVTLALVLVIMAVVIRLGLLGPISKLGKDIFGGGGGA